MRDILVRVVGNLRYRIGHSFQFSDVPDRRLVELVEGRDALVPGRTLDLGCGTGRNTLYLAGNGWDAVGVDMVGYALDVARGKAAAQGLSVRFLQGDVTQLDGLRLRGDFTRLVDLGCYHMTRVDRRRAYVESVTAIAAPGARLLVVGVSRRLGSPQEFLASFPGWSLVQANEVSGEEMAHMLLVEDLSVVRLPVEGFV